MTPTSTSTMNASSTTAGSSLPAVKRDGRPLPPVDLNSEEVLGGEESDEALSSDDEDEDDVDDAEADDDKDSEDDEVGVGRTDMLVVGPEVEDDPSDTEFVAPPSPRPAKKRPLDMESALSHAAKRLKVTPAVVGVSLPAAPLVVGPSDEWLAERKKELEAERAKAADVEMDGQEKE